MDESSMKFFIDTASPNELKEMNEIDMPRRGRDRRFL